ncbi:MAG: response regulator transcription factor [Bacteroidetes bacterium]|nr:response regulator transcription factor [Bacteroidota bacterium]
MGNIKVYIADDHTLFRKAFVKVLRELERIGEIKEAEDGKELLNLIAEDIPDVIIVDIEMPVMDGIKACEKLAIDYPEIKIIVVSMHDNKLTICQALQAGVHAFLPKVAKLTEFEKALYAVIDGKPYTNKVMEEALLYSDTIDKGKSSQQYTKADLTEREKAIMKLICKQLTNREIAEALFLSEHTVRNHRVRMMRKTGAKNTQGLVKFAFENGLSA